MNCFEGLLEKELQGRVFTGFAFDELVRIYRQQGRYDRLIEICEKAAKVQKDDVSLLTTLGDAYFKAEQFQSAIETFRNNRGNGARLDGRHRQARQRPDLLQAITTGRKRNSRKPPGGTPPGPIPISAGSAMAFMEVNECGRAERAFRRAIEIAPEDPMYHCDLGDALICLDEIRGAWDAYEKAVSLRPQSGAGFFNRLGNMLARRQAHSEAVSAFKKAIELDPAKHLLLSVTWRGRTRPSASTISPRPHWTRLNPVRERGPEEPDKLLLVERLFVGLFGADPFALEQLHDGVVEREHPHFP